MDGSALWHGGYCGRASGYLDEMTSRIPKKLQGGLDLPIIKQARMVEHGGLQHLEKNVNLVLDSGRPSPSSLVSPIATYEFIAWGMVVQHNLQPWCDCLSASRDYTWYFEPM